MVSRNIHAILHIYIYIFYTKPILNPNLFLCNTKNRKKKIRIKLLKYQSLVMNISVTRLEAD